ncbi:MAG: hypothetical protein HW387_957 [Parachlamydiales bacterium]|nr:hypothetical protein [Parachlamydiales bacterium]
MSVVASWTIHQTEVSVHQDQDRLKFSSKSNGEMNEGHLDLYSYDTASACRLIQIYHSVIETHLKEAIIASSFLPIFSWDKIAVLRDDRYLKAADVQVALFGRIDREARKILDAHWGIYTDSNKSSERFEIGDAADGVTQCLQNAPISDAANIEEMTQFANFFTVVLTLYPDNKIQSVALLKLWKPSASLFTSLFDRFVVLDEDHWAVTVVSAKDYSCRCCEKGIIPSSGHALIAYEGVKDGRQFRNFAHITTQANEDDPVDRKRKPNEARVNILENKRIRNLINGPTWPRPKIDVEKMLIPIKEAEKKHLYVPFAKTKDICAAIAPTATLAASATKVASQCLIVIVSIGCYLTPASTAMAALATVARTYFCTTLWVVPPILLTRSIRDNLKLNADRLNCVHWMKDQLPASGIMISGPNNSILTANGFVEYLNANPGAVSIRGQNI